MPGHIAPAYVATAANSLITAVTAGWFGELQMATSSPASCLSMLARLLSLIARGAEPPLAGMPQHSAELKKAMTAALDRGADLHVFDNCVGMIGNDVLKRGSRTTGSILIDNMTIAGN